MNPDLQAEIASLLRRSRQRHTLGRQQLVDVLVSFGRPATIPELIEAGVKQSQSSVYRNLGVLEQAGAVRRLSSVDDVARWELAEELTHHHHHLVCSECGRIDDITLPDSVERTLEKVVAKATNSNGYEIDGHRLELVGICPDC